MRKPSNKVQTGLRVDKPLHEKITALADKEKRSLNNMLEIMLTSYIEQYEKNNGKLVCF